MPMPKPDKWLRVIHTVETRWFFEGRLPARVLDWFRGRGPMSEQPERTDTYVCLPGCHTCGIKLREGRLEVKALTAPAGRFEPAAGVRAHAAGWVKWGMAPAGDVGIADLVRFDPADRLAHVRKRRYLRWYDFDAGGAALGDMPAEFGEQCQVELSALRVGFSRGDGDAVDARSSDWWSLCLEAGSRHGGALRNLEAAGALAFAVLPPAGMTDAREMGYPAWLDGLLPGASTAGM